MAEFSHRSEQVQGISDDERERNLDRFDAYAWGKDLTSVQNLLREVPLKAPHTPKSSLEMSNGTLTGLQKLWDSEDAAKQGLFVNEQLEPVPEE